MVRLYSGTPGSGKSLHAAKEIFFSVRMNQKIIVNFPINFNSFPKKIQPKARKLITQIDNSNLTVSWLHRYSMERHSGKRENETLLIIDEAGIMFNPREFTRASRADWVLFFTQHRKLGFDIILITQGDRLLDKQIRLCIETVIHHRAYKNYKTMGWLISLISGGLFKYIEVWYVNGLVCSHGSFRYHKRLGNLYDTFAIFTSDDSGVSTDFHGNLLHDKEESNDIPEFVFNL